MSRSNEQEQMTVTARQTEELMSVLGHELRSPLTAIRGAATLLLQAHRDLPPEKVRELLSVIDGAAARMADRVEDVLVTGRLDGGRQQVFVEEVDVGEVVEDVLEAMQRELLEETGYGSEEWHSLGSSTANTARQNNRVHAFLALDAHKVSDQKLDPGEMIRTHVVPWQKFVDDLADGRLEIPGLHLAALWQLRTFAKQTRDPRLLALAL